MSSRMGGEYIPWSLMIQTQMGSLCFPIDTWRLIIFAVSVSLFVNLWTKNFNIGHNLWLLSDRGHCQMGHILKKKKKKLIIIHNLWIV